MDVKNVVQTYNEVGSIKKTAKEVCISEQKVRKILLDAGAFESDLAIGIRELFADGNSVKAIAEKLKLSESAVQSYLPYTKGVYMADEPTSNAIRIRKCRLAKNVK